MPSSIGPAVCVTPVRSSIARRRTSASDHLDPRTFRNRRAWPRLLQSVCRRVLADALMALVLRGLDLPTPTVRSLLTGHVTRRHDFGFGSGRPGMPGCAWRGRCRTRNHRRASRGTSAGRCSASTSRWRRWGCAALQRTERASIAPTLSANERDAFAVTVALLNPFALHDEDRDAIADAVARGRAAGRVARRRPRGTLDASRTRSGWMAGGAGRCAGRSRTSRPASARCSR